LENQDLQAYLDAFRSEGEFDSEGFFTLDRQKAVGKIARYLLPDEGIWILKTVQAAYHLEALELSIKEVRAYSSLSYRLSEPIDPKDLRNGLIEGTEIVGIQLVCQALRSVAVTQKRLVTLTLKAGKRTNTFLLNDGEVNEIETESEQPADSTLQILVQRPLGTTDTLFERGKEALEFAENYLEGHRSEEYEHLIDRARVSPVPLRLNGARIDDMNIPWSLKPGERTYYVGALYAQSRDKKENYFTLPQAISRRKSKGILPGNHGPLASMSFNSFTRANCLLGVHYYAKREYEGTVFSRLHLVKDGVIVDTAFSDFQATIGFDLIMSPPQIKTDITGLKANIPASLTERYRRYLIQFRNPLKKLALYLVGPSFQVRSYQAPNEFEGLEFSSKLRMFAAGRLKSRRDAGQSLEWTLSRAPFNVLEVGQST
jgi:hypothetical protein